MRKARTTLLCFALLFIIIALMYQFQSPVVNSFMSFGDVIDKAINRVSSILAVSFAIATLVLDLCIERKGGNE